MAQIPYLPSFVELCAKLNSKQINRWELEREAPDDLGNVRASFYDLEGKRYLVQIQYHAETNAINPPVVRQLVPSESALNWTSIENVFNDERHLIKPSIPCYVDSEIQGQQSAAVLEPILEEIRQFSPLSETTKFTVFETQMGTYPGLNRLYSTPTQKLNLLMNEEGYAIIYEGTHFLIVGNFGGHPFLYCSFFGFNNSDGSTFDYTINDTLTLSLAELKDRAIHKSVEYPFDQQH